jgi:serine/threonine protein kinase
MLEEVHKGETYYAPMLLFAFLDHVLVYFCSALPTSAAGACARNNIVSLLDCVRKDDRTSLIFEFVEGRDFVKDLPTFSEMHVARYMRELFIALAHVHRSAAAAAGLSSVLSHACEGIKSFTEMSSRPILC